MVINMHNIKNYRNNLARLAGNPKTWEDTYRPEHEYNKRVIMEVCLGELAEDGMKTLALTGGKVPQTAPIVHNDHFQAQGLEGKAIIPMTFRDAIIRTDILTDYRWQIKVK